MRPKHVLSLLPFPDLKIIWDRITASRIAIIYFVFSILNCSVQLVFQAQALSINNQAAEFLSGLIYTGNASFQGFFTLGSQLRFCDHVPNSFSVESCQLVWNGTIGNGRSTVGLGNNSSVSYTPTTASVIPSTIPTHSSSLHPVTSEKSSLSPSLSKNSVTSSLPATTTSSSRTAIVLSATTTTIFIEAPAATITRTESSNDKRAFLPQPHVDIVDYRAITLNGQTGVSLQGFGYNGKNVTLDNKCLVALNWPLQTLRNTKREDITFLAFQVWVLGMSLVALLNESIPHIIATVLTHLSATAWGGFQIYNTGAFHKDFRRLTTDGACHINLLPWYWTSRARAEIPSLALNVAALLVSCFLSFRLVTLFGWQTFKRVGASRTINRIYKLVLTLSIVIQLSLFFVISAVALWVDQLYNGAIGVMASQGSLYQAFLTVVLILLIPWLLMGWVAARKELKFPMIVFLALSALYLIGWGLMFDSKTFRWTFVQWGFFGATATLSALLILIGFIVGIMCRLNFDKGLAHYLNAEEPLPEDDFIDPAPGMGDDEKVDFPSAQHPIPTFSATFGSSTEVSEIPFQMGPRFISQSPASFGLRVDIESVTHSSGVSSTSPKTVSSGSTSPAGSAVTATEPSVGRSRWVIE